MPSSNASAAARGALPLIFVIVQSHGEEDNSGAAPASSAWLWTTTKMRGRAPRAAALVLELGAEDDEGLQEGDGGGQKHGSGRWR